MSELLWGAAVGLLGVGFGLWQRRSARAAGEPAAGETLKRTRFVQSQRLEAVGRLAGGVAHDFNNLLGVIIGHAELARTASVDNAAVRARLEQVLGAAQRAAELTQQLLAFSRRQVLEPSVLDLNRQVAEIEPLLRRRLGADVALVTRPSHALGRVRADASQIGRVLLTLAANAREALPQGGSFTIATGNVELDDAYAREHEPLVPGSYVELRISDDGRGMDASTREHVFEPFFSTKPDGPASGLGLSTVYGIVKQSGGFVWVESAPGRGTTFTIQLPRCADAVEETPQPVATPAVGEGQTILVVEDEDGLRSLICEILENAGYQVLSAASGPEALSLSKAIGEPIHLLITDVIMPGMSGTELAARLAEQRPQTRALLISGYIQDAIADRGASAGSIALLRKPFTGASLLEQVSAALAGSGA